MIYIVGLGPGHKEYIMPKALEVMQKCKIIIGFKRAIDSIGFINNKKVYINKLNELDEFISGKKNQEYDISIVASGDPTFYGITNYIKSKTDLEIQVIPGISSFQYLTCRLNMPWNNAYIGSLHGRIDKFLDVVREYKLSIWLTDKDNNPTALCKILSEAEIDCKVIIGEDLSYDNELISIGNPQEYLNKTFSSLNIFIVENLEI